MDVEGTGVITTDEWLKFCVEQIIAKAATRATHPILDHGNVEEFKAFVNAVLTIGSPVHTEMYWFLLELFTELDPDTEGIVIQFNKYGQTHENIKLYVSTVFTTDDFTDLMPNYLSFVKGIVDSDDFPLNILGETLDMIKKIFDDKYGAFWSEYSTNIKLGVIEDTANRTRLAKLLGFTSSNGKLASLAEYVENRTSSLSATPEGDDRVHPQPLSSRDVSRDVSPSPTFAARGTSSLLATSEGDGAGALSRHGDEDHHGDGCVLLPSVVGNEHGLLLA